MFDPAQLAALAAVHRRGSFDLAAAELHVTPSAISQRIKSLEETAGTLLIREAGGHVSDLAGRPDILKSDSIVAGNAHVHGKLLEHLPIRDS